MYIIHTSVYIYVYIYFNNRSGFFSYLYAQETHTHQNEGREVDLGDEELFLPPVLIQSIQKH